MSTWKSCLSAGAFWRRSASRIVVPPPGVPVGSLVADGKVELGFQQLSELMSLPGIEVLGPLPPEIQTITIFSGGISSGCAQPEAARALLGYLASPPSHRPSAITVWRLASR